MKNSIKKLILAVGFVFLTQSAFAASNFGYTQMNTSSAYSPINTVKTTNYTTKPMPTYPSGPVNIYDPNLLHIQRVDNVDIDIEFLIDYSNSMRPWITQAKKTMQQILTQIPQTTYVGMRVFGHKMNNKTINSNNLLKNVMHDLGGIVNTTGNLCQATEQIIPISKVNSAYLINAMNNTQIGSATPLTFALKQAVNNDFRNQNLFYKKKIILITDGGESCGGDPCRYIRDLVKERNDFQIDVIMINGSNNLKCLSDATNGDFYSVSSSSGFDSALKNSTRKTPTRTDYNYLYVPPVNNSTHYQFLPE